MNYRFVVVHIGVSLFSIEINFYDPLDGKQLNFTGVFDGKKGDKINLMLWQHICGSINSVV
jgi:hypothetical protein